MLAYLFYKQGGKPQGPQNIGENEQSAVNKSE